MLQKTVDYVLNNNKSWKASLKSDASQFRENFNYESEEEPRLYELIILILQRQGKMELVPQKNYANKKIVETRVD